MELHKAGSVNIFTVYFFTKTSIPVFSISRVNGIKPTDTAVSVIFSKLCAGRSYWTNKPSTIYSCLVNI